MKKEKTTIESLERKNIYQVPDEYFDQLPLKIQSRIDRHPKHVASTLFDFKLIHKLVWGFTAAAMIVLVVGWFYYSPSSQTIDAEHLIADIRTEDLIEYLLIENISDEDILASLSTDFLLNEAESMQLEIFDVDASEDDLESIYSELDLSTEIM